MTRIIIFIFSLVITSCAQAQDWSKPDLQSSKSTFMTEMHDIINQCAKQDFTTGSNIPDGSIRYNRSSDLWQEYSSSGDTWATVPVNAAQILSGSITTTQIADGTITGTDIQGSTITGSKIASDTIEEANLHPDAATRSTLLMEAFQGAPDGTASDAVMYRAVLSGSGIPLRSVMPKSGKVTHISIASSHSVTGGTVTVTLYKNGSTTSKSVNMTSSTPLSNYFDITDESFNVGDYFELYVSRSSFTAASGTATVIADIWGHFTY